MLHSHPLARAVLRSCHMQPFISSISQASRCWEHALCRRRLRPRGRAEPPPSEGRCCRPGREHCRGAHAPFPRYRHAFPDIGPRQMRLLLFLTHSFLTFSPFSGSASETNLVKSLGKLLNNATLMAPPDHCYMIAVEAVRCAPVIHYSIDTRLRCTQQLRGCDH